MKQYIIKTFSVQDGWHDALGGKVSEDNAYIAAYPVVLEGQPPISSLEVGEQTKVHYSLSGGSTKAFIERVA